MNIAITYESVVPARGGCETYIGDLVRRLVADGHAVHLYACTYDAEAVPVEVVFHPLPGPTGPRFLRPWRFAAASEKALSGTHHDVVLGFVKTWHQDVIVPQGGFHAASARYNLRKHRCPVVRTLAATLKWFDPCHWSYQWLERRQFVERQPLVVAPSRMVGAHAGMFYGLGPDRVRVIPNAIDPDRFAAYDRPALRARLRDELGVPAPDSVALFLGHNYRLKGLAPLLRAVAVLPQALPFTLLIGGSPKTRPFERLAARLGVRERVRFLGFRPDVRECYFAADFLVHPTFYDPCALVTLEALACGLPVLTTVFNGAHELLPPPLDEAVIDDPHDAHLLAHRIQQWCDPRRRAAGARAARQAAAAWTFEDHYRALLAVLEEAAARKRAA